MQYKIPIGYLAEWIIDFVRLQFETALYVLSVVANWPVMILLDILNILPFWFFAVAIGCVVFRRCGYRPAFVVFGGFLLIYGLQLWQETIQTIAVTLVSTLYCLLFGIPLGILAAEKTAVERCITPVLDWMQTTPSFVYLIAVVLLFGMGVVPGIIATMVFAFPPSVRLTMLGFKEVDETLLEAGRAFGCNYFQLIWRIKLPAAKSAIFTGVNQTIMMALSMIVIASLVGAPGLGLTVLVSLGSVDIAKGIDAGISVVLVAFILDKITQYRRPF